MSYAKGQFLFSQRYAQDIFGIASQGLMETS